MVVGINVEGLGRVIELTSGMQQRLTNMVPIATDIQLAVQADVDERFNQAPSTEEGGTVYGGEFWPALSEDYLKYNPQRQGGQILRDTGELLQSYTIGQKGNVANAAPTEVSFGSAIPKAGYLSERFPQVFIHDDLISVVENIVVGYVNAQ